MYETACEAGADVLKIHLAVRGSAALAVLCENESVPPPIDWAEEAWTYDLWKANCPSCLAVHRRGLPNYEGFARAILDAFFGVEGGDLEFTEVLEVAQRHCLVRQEKYDPENPQHEGVFGAPEPGDLVYFRNYKPAAEPRVGGRMGSTSSARRGTGGRGHRRVTQGGGG